MHLPAVDMPLAAVLSTGLLLRLVLATVSFHGDILVSLQGVLRLLGGMGVYQIPGFTYPPLWLYLLSVLFFPLAFIVDPASFVQTIPELAPARWTVAYDSRYLTSPGFNLLVRLPLIAADLVIALILYRVLLDWTDQARARVGAALWMLNPLMIMTSSIHGQFDALPALCILLSALYLIAGRHLPAGIALSFGLAFKIYPFILLPLYGLLVISGTFWRWRAVSYRTAAQHSLIEAMKFGGGLLLPLLLFIGPVLQQPFFESVFGTRLQGLSYGTPSAYYLGGGLNLWSLKVQPLFASFFTQHAPLITQVTSLILMAGSVLVAVIAGWLSRRSLVAAALLGQTAVLVLLFLTAKVVNAQYLLWLLPSLILVYVLTERSSLLVALIVISVAGFAHMPTMYNGFEGLFLPLVIKGKLSSLEQVFQGFVAAPQVRDRVVMYLGVAVTAMLLLILIALPGCFAPLARRFPPSAFPDHRFRPSSRLPLVRATFIGLSALLILGYGFTLLGKAVIAKPQGMIDLITPVSGDRTLASVHYRLEGGPFRGEYQVVAIPKQGAEPPQRNVYLYMDPSYPSFADQAATQHLFQHLRAQLQLRDYPGTVQPVDAVALVEALHTETPNVIIIASEVLPVTVLDQAGDFTLLKDWLERGGTLVWIGSNFGHYLGRPGNILLPANAWDAQTAVLGEPLFRGADKRTTQESYAFVQSDVGAALGLEFDIAWAPLDPVRVQQRGGQNLGRLRRDALGAPVSSITYVPVGQGHLVAFAAGLGYDAHIIGHDIAQLLFTRFLEGEKSALATAEIKVGRHQTVEGVLAVALPPGSQTLAVSIYSKFDQAPLFTSRVLSLAADAATGAPR